MSDTVLLVDDDPSVLSGLKRLLRKEAYALLTAGSAEEGAEILASRHVDLIISDEEMPGMSGTEFLARTAQHCPDTVRIVLTGRPSLDAALRAINEGKVHQFLTKPCNEIDLAITIRKALGQKDRRTDAPEHPPEEDRQTVLVDEARVLRRLQGEARKAAGASTSGHADGTETSSLPDDSDA